MKDEERIAKYASMPGAFLAVREGMAQLGLQDLIPPRQMMTATEFSTAVGDLARRHGVEKPLLSSIHGDAVDFSRVSLMSQTRVNELPDGEAVFVTSGSWVRVRVVDGFPTYVWDLFDNSPQRAFPAMAHNMVAMYRPEKGPDDDHQKAARMIRGFMGMYPPGPAVQAEVENILGTRNFCEKQAAA